MDIRTTGKQLAANLTTTVALLSLGTAGIASLMVWGTTSSSSSSATSSSSSSTSTSTGDSGQVPLVGPNTSIPNQATTSGS
ncbi:MAG: hypothetical protein JWP05_931 [Microbacteriaceae bacterium]|nr:hypothetical protein [Microbacteriaceae bacterium]